ncbi:MAG: Na+/H+ antiporter subunit E [Anaerovoracaceae bacterium]
MKRYWLREAVILFLLWIILSGRFEVKYLLFGIVSAAVIAALCVPLQKIPGESGKYAYSLLEMKFTRLASYWIWLFFEIVKSSWAVARAVLSPKMKINPHIVEFVCPFDNPAAVTTLVNSIILTPGTVTLDVLEGNRFLVHVLTDEAAEGLFAGNMQRHIAALFGEKCEINQP